MHDLSINELSELVRSREVSPVEVTDHMLDRIEAIDPTYRSYVTVTAERARQQANRAEAEIAGGNWRGPLHGVPLAVKDILFTDFAPTTAGSVLYRDYQPDHNATVVDRLEGAGAVTLGKLKTTEHAFTAHHPEVEPPVNPWNPDYWSGASSSGPGVATAARLAFGTVGSDTAGSIRFPASQNGVTAIKPGWGRVSRHGVFPVADSLDHIGPLCRSAIDAAIMLRVMAGPDPADPTAVSAPVPDYAAACQDDLRGIRIGLPRDYATQDVADPVVAALEQAAEALRAAGAEIKEIVFPDYQPALAGLMVILGAEAVWSHRETYPAKAELYGPELGGFLEVMSGVSAQDLAAAQLARQAFSYEVSAMFRDIDLMLIPTSARTAFTRAEWDELAASGDVVRAFRFSAPYDLTGSPTMMLPAGFDDNQMPITMQLVSGHLGEATLCRAGAAFQRQTDWHTRHPR